MTDFRRETHTSGLTRDDHTRRVGCSPPPSTLFVEHARPDEDLRDAVRIAVRRRATVLEVAAPILADLPRDTDAGAAVGDAGGEVVDAGRLVESRQTSGVVGASVRVVRHDVLLVFRRELLDGRLDHPETRRDTHYI